VLEQSPEHGNNYVGIDCYYYYYCWWGYQCFHYHIAKTVNREPIPSDFSSTEEKFWSCVQMRAQQSSTGSKKKAPNSDYPSFSRHIS
jgi:hypothetical protein